jgi:hypothetical protein
MIDYDEWASKFVGKCWHKFEWSDTDCYDVYYTCTKCGIEQVGNTNFHPTLDDSDYLELVRYVRSHKEISNFLNFLWAKWDDSKAITSFDMFLLDILFDRELGTKAIYEFFSNEVGI